LVGYRFDKGGGSRAIQNATTRSGACTKCRVTIRADGTRESQ